MSMKTPKNIKEFGNQRWWKKIELDFEEII